MPSKQERVFSGTRYWNSKKARNMNRLEHIQCGAWIHYALWIALAGVNGTFELDEYKILKDVYSYAEPNMPVEWVRDLLDEFLRIKLLKKFKKNGKWYLWFVGSHNRGLLPPLSERTKYPNDPPWPPQELIDEVDEIDTSKESQEPEDEETMKFKDRISKLSRDILRKAIRPDDRCWSEMNSLKNQTSVDDVVAAFEAFARENESRDIQYPLSAFLKKEEGYLSGGAETRVVPQNNEVLDELCADLYILGEAAFTGKHRAALAKLLTEYKISEILLAYKEFVAERDDFNRKFSPRDFVEGGAVAIIMATRKRKILEQENEKLIERTRKKMLEDAAKEAPPEEETFTGLPEV